MFVNRTKELSWLEERYRKGESEFIVVYGKRRVGKTELMKQFFRERPHIFYLADKRSSQEQLKDASAIIGRYFEEKFLEFRDWSEILEYLATRDKRIVLVIDEFPYLMENDPAIPSIFQKGWDMHLKKSRVFMMVCGSSIGMMERHVLGYKSPLYGRRTGQIHLKPMKPGAMAEYFPGIDVERFIEFYSILGGIPAYWRFFDPKISVMENIKKFIFNKEEPLYGEVDFVLREEFREPRNYFSILRAISFGKTRLNDIVQETGLDRGLVSKYLSVLRELHVVVKEVPVTKRDVERSRKGLYRIQENLFKFWFRFVHPNRNYIEEGRPDIPINEDLKHNLNLFISSEFENICRESLWNIDLPYTFNKLGKWWQGEEELDIVGLNEKTDDILFAECKWRNRKTGIEVAKELLKRSEKVAWRNDVRKEHFIIFSRSGFTSSCRDFCNENDISMFDLEDVGKSFDIDL